MKYFVIIVIATFFLVPLSSAQAVDPLVVCGTSTTQACTTCDILKQIKRVIDFIVNPLVPILAILFAITAGLMIVLGGLNPELISQGRKMLTMTVTGVVIIYTSWLVANTVIKVIAGENDTAKSWFKLDCGPAKPLQANIPTGGRMSEKDAQQRLENGAVQVKPGAELNQVNTKTVDATIALQKECTAAFPDCKVIVTDATSSAVGHDDSSSNLYTHANGYKIDLQSKNPDGSPNTLTQYITTNSTFTKISPSPTEHYQRWQDQYGNVYMLESPGTGNEHWDVVVK
ncbi:MAG: pilin [Patescibacteria group bacterium]